MEAKEICPIHYTLSILGGKWKLEILARLMQGTKRFKELEREVVGITPSMLSRELKGLEEQQIIRRELFAEVPLRVEYSITDNARSLYPIVEAIKSWGTEQLRLSHQNKMAI